MKDLKERTLRGGIAKIFAQGASFLLRVGSLIVLARLLDPEDFGLVAMVTAIAGVFSVLKDAGLSAATVQRDTISNDQMSTLFWVNMLVGLTLAFLLIASAPIIVTLYHEPRLFWVTVALAVDFVFAGAMAQHSALLQRQMRFDTIALIDIIALLAGMIVAVAMAVGGLGYWALVGQAVILPVACAICTWTAVRWIPGMPRRNVGIRSMMRFGGTVTLNVIVVYIAYNIEKVLLGRFWGADALGIYGRAYQLINVPTSNLNSAFGGVVFSALSRIQDDPNRLKSYFLKGYSMFLTLTLPITLSCALFADDIVLVLLGPKWTEAAPIFRLLAPTILVFALINPLGWLLFATGRVERSLKVAFVLAPLVIAAVVAGIPYGPSGVAFAYSAVMMAWVIPHIAWCIHGSVISLWDIVRILRPIFISGIIAAVLGFAVQYFYSWMLSPIPRLVLESSVLFGSYFLMFMYGMKQKGMYLDIFRTLWRGPSIEEKEKEAAIN